MDLNGSKWAKWLCWPWLICSVQLYHRVSPGITSMSCRQCCSWWSHAREYCKVGLLYLELLRWKRLESRVSKKISPKKTDQSCRQHMVSKQKKPVAFKDFNRSVCYETMWTPKQPTSAKLGGCPPSFDSGWCREVSWRRKMWLGSHSRFFLSIRIHLDICHKFDGLSMFMIINSH